MRTSETSIRLFRNNFLESLTHVHPIVPLLFWAPFIAWLLIRTFGQHHLQLLPVLGIGLAGLISWTLFEYLAHRFLFHFPARSRAGKWLVFMFHGVHHDAPRDKSRLVMPPAGAVLIMVVIWGVFSLFIPAPWLEPFIAFFVAGYLVYDYIHYATHHFPMRNRVARYLKHHHMKHHFSTDQGRFGVSSPFWDIVFRTQP